MTAPSENPENGIRARRASSFGTQAAAYADYRPGYPDAAVLWALQPVVDRPTIRVADVGAGTGKLTAAILRQDRVDVVAIEPDRAMLAELRMILPEVTSLPGQAEALPLPDGSVDAVLCGQAAHWFEMDLALPEIARVLTRGGVFAGLWNMDDDRVPWVAGLERVCPPTNSLRQWHDDPQAWPGRTAKRTAPASKAGRAWPRGSSQHDLFGPAEQAEFEHGQPNTVDSLVALVATHSRQLVMDDDAERGELLGRVRAYLLQQPETAHGEFILPMVTGVLRSVKL